MTGTLRGPTTAEHRPLRTRPQWRPSTATAGYIRGRGVPSGLEDREQVAVPRRKTGLPVRVLIALAAENLFRRKELALFLKGAASFPVCNGLFPS